MSSGKDLVAVAAVELRRLTTSAQISPVELLPACIARMETVNPFGSAVTAGGYDRVRAEAEAARRAVREGRAPGPLHGLPTEGTLEPRRLCARREGMPTDPVCEDKATHGMPALNACRFIFRNG